MPIIDPFDNPGKQAKGIVDPFDTQSAPTPQITTPEQEMQSYIDTLSPAQRFLIGVGKGMTDIATGVKQRGAQVGEALGIVSPETVQGITNQVAEDRALFKPLADQSFAAKAGKFVGETAPLVTMPGGVAGGFAKRALTSAGAGALVGAMQPTTKDESMAANALVGGITGGATSVALSGAGKAFNALKGNVPANEVTQLSRKYNIPTTLGEDTGNPIVQHAETILEKVPIVGLRKLRKQQQESAEETAKGFLAKYIVDPNSPDIMRSNRDFVDAIYQGVQNISKDIPEQITPSQTKGVASALLSRYPDIFKKFQDTEMETVLRDIAKGTRDISDSTVNNVLLGKNTAPKTLTFDEAWTLRKGLGEMIGQARKKLAAGDVNETQYGQIKALFAAVDNDMENWASKIGKPEIKETLNAANDAYRNYVVKYDVIQRAYDKASGVVGAGEMFSPKKFSTALKNVAYKDKALKRFTPQEIQEMTGLANIMQVVKRGGQFMENPPTGARYGIPALASMAGLAATIKGIPFVALGRVLSGTQKGKNLVRAASRIEPTSPAMNRIVDSLYNMLPKMGAEAATDSTS